MLTGTALDPAIVRAALEPHGNSLVVAGSASRMRIHIHCNDPEQVFELAGQLGTVENTKADDMIGQARSLGRSDRRIAIVTDSAADLPGNLPDELNIHVVPLRVQFGHHTYLDKIGITPAEFRHELASNPERPGTSQPTAGDFRRMYEFLTTHFEEVVSIHLGGRLSGTFQAACNVAAQIDGSAQIRVIDSANASVGQGLIVKRAAELAADGIRGEALVNAVGHEIRATRSFALVTNLDAAVRSGRVRPALKRLADWLRLNPVLMNTPAGKIGVHGFLPGRSRLVERFGSYIARTIGRDGKWEIAIAHAESSEEAALILRGELEKRLDCIEQLWQTDIGPALGVHAGMDALVVALRPVE